VVTPANTPIGTASTSNRSAGDLNDGGGDRAGDLTDDSQPYVDTVIS
jgi:hypothetical protein